MKRHVSLHPLSQHHHFALIQALELRRAAEAPLENRATLIAKHAAKFLRFWHKSGHVHFREEEEILLPAYSRHVRLDEDADVMRILADHAEIRATVLNFEEQFAAKSPIEPERMAYLAQLLHDHVRFEENVVFPRIEKVLGESGLNSMGRGLTRLHSKNDPCEI